MERKTEPPASRFLTFAEVAHHLRISAESVRDKALRPGSELPAVNVGNGTERAVWRITRDSFDRYCQQIERESAERFAS